MDMRTPSLLGGNRRLLSCLSLLLGVLSSAVLLDSVRDDFVNSGLVINAVAAELRGSPATENESSVNPEVMAQKPEAEEVSSDSKPEFPTTPESDSPKTNVQETSQEGTKPQETAEVSSSDQQTPPSEQPVAEGTPETSSEASMTEDSGYYAQESSEQDYSGDEIYERTGPAEDEADYEQWVTAFDIPEQLRRRIEGDDPMYYNLILEERLYLMDAHTDEGEGGARKQAEDPNSLLVAKKNGVYAVCYARSEEDIWDRCAHAAEAAEGIYIQMQDMTDFGRTVDPDEGVDPSTVKAALTEEHYTRALRDLGKSWFNNIKDMKDMTGLKVAGIWFGPPDYDKIDALLKKYPDVFDGIYVNWEDGVGACVDKVSEENHKTTSLTTLPKKDFFLYLSFLPSLKSSRDPSSRMRDRRFIVLEFFLAKEESLQNLNGSDRSPPLLSFGHSWRLVVGKPVRVQFLVGYPS